MRRACVSFLFILLVSIPNYPLSRITQEPDQGTPVTLIPLGPKLSGPRLSFATVSGISEPLRMVIRDDDAWDKMWKRITAPCVNAPPAPQIDFTREMIIVAALGERPTSGYWIVIDKAYERGHQLEITVRSILPPPNAGQFQMATQPVDVVRIAKTGSSVIFRETQETFEFKSQ